MRKSPLARTLALGLTVSLVLPSCALVQITDRYFIGSSAPAVFENRQVTGFFLMPIAMVLDVATAPLQILLLVLLGDDALYSKATRTTFATLEAFRASEAYAQLTEAQRATLEAALERALADEGPAGREILLGLDAEGAAVAIPLTPELEARLAAHLDGRTPVKQVAAAR
jgi:hypothetical protein